ncbi:MAG: NADH-quinone oxidoreductase subunit N [Acidobacteriaceae bacterium]
MPLPTSVIALLPEYVLTLTGVLIVLIEAVLKPTASRKPLGWLAIAGATATGLISWYQLRLGALSAFSGSIQVDAFSIFFHLLIGAVVVVTLLGSLDYFDGHASHAGEYFALVLFGAVGMMLMTCSVDLLMVFIGLEISSISTYILAGFRKGEGASVEASIKYFLLGSFATAFFLYGIALAYGATGSTGIAAIAAGLGASATPRMAFLALAMMLVGLGFKVSAAPFHLWTPDVYQGAPAPVVGLMSTAPKAAAFAVLLRITFCGFPLMQQRWAMLLWGLAALSMTIGNLGALKQTNVKRMLAYSSIAHAGYLLAAFTAFPQAGISAACFYTAAYAAMNVGAFAVITQIGGYKETLRSFKDYQGLALRRPVLAALLALFLLSLIGIPFTGGFFGKFYVFAAVLQAGHVWLAVIGLINSGVACFYYLRLLSSVYTRPVATFSAPGQTTPSLAPTPAISVPAGIGLALAAAATLLLGILPGAVLHLANSAGSGLRATYAIAAPSASSADSPPSLPSSGQPR